MAKKASRSRAKGETGKWLRQQWVDVKTGKPCGRKSASDSSRPYPACRPKAAAAKMSAAEKRANAARKQGPKRISWTTTPSGRKRKKK